MKISAEAIEKLLKDSMAIQRMPADERKKILEFIRKAPKKKQNEIAGVLLKEKAQLEAIEKAHQEKMKALSSKLTATIREFKTLIRRKAESETKKADEKKEAELLDSLNTA